MSGLFARRKGRHCRRHSSTGWSGLAGLVPARRERAPRLPALVAAPTPDDLIPFADYRHPYSPKDAA